MFCFTVANVLELVQYQIVGSVALASVIIGGLFLLTYTRRVLITNNCNGIITIVFYGVSGKLFKKVKMGFTNL